LEPGTVDGTGVADVPGGVAGVPGGVAVPPEGVAAPGVWVWPALPDVSPGVVPPEGALCAATHVTDRKSRERSVPFFLADI
jgi:hypothetical protein